MNPVEFRVQIRRRFTNVGTRRVHYLRAGSGPPVLLVHSSPANVRILLPEIRYLAAHFTCFAFDTPGFGLSEPLPLVKMLVADLADALADNMRAIGLPACPVYGSHTGAAIVLEFAARHPTLVTGIVLDGVPIFTQEEGSYLIDGYFKPFPIDELGGHFSAAWTRFRDQSIWFPWFDRRPENLNRYDLSSPARTHEWMMMYFYAAKSYMPAYRAAFEYGERASPAVESLSVPAVFTATETDMLHPHLKRLPPLKPDQEICAIGNSIERKHALIAERFANFASGENAPADNHPLVSSTQVERQFIDLSHGQIHVRVCGKRSSPALLLLHDAPGSARFLEPLIEALSEHFFVCAPDLPGCGESDPLGESPPTIADFVASLKEFCRVADLMSPILYGIGFGSSLAIALSASTLPAGRLIVRGVLLPNDAERNDLRNNFAPEIKIEQDGSHWYRTWLMLRDSQIYWPWYDYRKDAQRHAPGEFGAEHLHLRTFDVMKCHSTYHHLIHAVLDCDAVDLLKDLSVPTVVVEDAGVPLSIYDKTLRDIVPSAFYVEFADEDSHAKDIANHFGRT